MARKRSTKPSETHAGKHTGKSPIEIVQEAMPGMEVIPASELSSPGPAADAVRRAVTPGASLRHLKEDLGGLTAESASRGAADTSLPAQDDQIEVFQVRPKKPSSDTGSGPRTVIVHKQKGIIGIQG